MNQIDETTAASHITKSLVLEEMERLLRSRQFASAPRMTAFLRYIVSSELNGDASALKETCIGVAVFDRSPSYDPREDGIVRVEARRLRQKLDEHYDQDGSEHLCRIEVPRGGYRPVFNAPASSVKVQDRGIAESTQTVRPEHLGIEQPGASPHKRTSGPLITGAPPTVYRSSRFRLRRLRLPLGIVLVAAAIWALFMFHPNRQYDSSGVVSLTTFIGQEMQPILSPDDKNFAFVWDGDKGKYDVYREALPGSNPVRLTDEPGHNLYPKWSPDGRDIAYVNMTPTEVSVYLRPSVGGPHRLVTQFSPESSPWHKDARNITSYLSVAWTPDGSNLVTNVVPANRTNNQVGLFSVPLGGGVLERLTSPPAGSSDFEPAISSDGESIAFFRATSKLTGDIWLLKRASKEVRRLTSSLSDVRGITWSKDNAAVIYSSNQSGLYRIRFLKIATGEDKELPTIGVNSVDPFVSRNGRRLVFTDSQVSSNIWRGMLSDKVLRQERIVTSSMSSTSPSYAPDGRKITFVSNRTGHWEVWISDADGQNTSQLTKFDGPLLDAPHWAPDGQSIVFESRPHGRSAIFTVRLSDQHVTQLTDGSANAKMPVWSRDGKWIFFNSDTGGTARIWRMTPEGKDQRLLSEINGYDVVQTSNSNLIFFLSGDQYLYQMSVEGGQAKRIDKVGKVGLSRYLTSSSDSLLFVDDSARQPTLEQFNPRTGQLTRVGTLDGQIFSSTPSLTVAPDGNTILYALQESSSSDVRLISLPKE